MPQNLCFAIRNLLCSYREDKPVLSIKELDIPRGQLIFILGLSGIGKSTFIETLGLMNNTVRYNQHGTIQFYPDDNAQSAYELTELWDKDDEEISRFRNDYFSFIFQETNLMPNFTAGENMCISQLIKGVSLEEARKQVLDVMSQLYLPATAFDKHITALSGGQRQRLAFVRAITSDFAVLFGDEPTGNLDKETAFRLMKILKNNLKTEDRTGIIVSHDLELASAFADQIYLLTPVQIEGGIYGEVTERNILVRRDDHSPWAHTDGRTIENTVDYLYQYLNVAENITI